MTNYVPRINLSGNEILGGGILYIERFYQNYLYYTITHLRRPALSYHHFPYVDLFPGGGDGETHNFQDGQTGRHTEVHIEVVPT